MPEYRAGFSVHKLFIYATKEIRIVLNINPFFLLKLLWCRYKLYFTNGENENTGKVNYGRPCKISNGTGITKYSVAVISGRRGKQQVYNHFRSFRSLKKENAFRLPGRNDCRRASLQFLCCAAVLKFHYAAAILVSSCPNAGPSSQFTLVDCYTWGAVEHCLPTGPSTKDGFLGWAI